MNDSSLSSPIKEPLLKRNLVRALDINIDLGQTPQLAFWQSPKADALLNLVSSVNLPCFVHDGLPQTVATLAQQAKGHHCAIGAHVGYPTPQNLGYEAPTGLSPTDLKHWLWVQLGALQTVLKPYNLGIEHIRPHGALYADSCTNEEIALAFIEAVQQFDAWLPILLPPTPLIKDLSQKYSVIIAHELVVGKRYNSQLLLDTGFKDHQKWLPPNAIWEQVRHAVVNNELATSDGKKHPLVLQSLHLSVELPELLTLATKTVELLGQAVPVNLAKVHHSGWLQGFNDRNMEPALPLYEDY